jgi:hypothetical protein
MLVLTGSLDWIDSIEEWPPLIAATTVTAALLLIIAVPLIPARRWLNGWLPGLGDADHSRSAGRSTHRA